MATLKSSAAKSRRKAAAPARTPAESEAQRLERFLHERRLQALARAMWSLVERDRGAPPTAAAEIAQLRAALGPRPATVPPPMRHGRGKRKLTDEVWAAHLQKHPLDKIGPSGNLMGAPLRQRLIEAEQGKKVSRATVTRRLQRSRP